MIDPPIIVPLASNSGVRLVMPSGSISRPPMKSRIASRRAAGFCDGVSVSAMMSANMTLVAEL